MLCLNLSSILVSLYCYVLLARLDFYWQGQTQSNTQSQHSLNRGPNKRIPLWKVYALGIEIFEMSYIQLEVVDSLSTGQKARSEDFKQVIQQFSMISCLFVSSEVVLLVCGECRSPFALHSVHELIVLGNSVRMGRKWSDIWNQYVPSSGSWHLSHGSKPLRHLTTKPNKNHCARLQTSAKELDLTQDRPLPIGPVGRHGECCMPWIKNCASYTFLWRMDGTRKSLLFIFALNDASFQLISTHFPSFAHLAVEGPRRNAWDLGALAQIQ